MSTATYNNLPRNTSADSSSDVTTDAQANYYTKPLELNSDVFSAIKAFFTNRGFDNTSADSIAVVIIRQAKKDGYNPMQILDTLSGLGEVEISALLAEILNYNRFKTSYLGYARAFNSNQEVKRNILA